MTKFQMKRTTVRAYDEDLQAARAWYDERTGFADTDGLGIGPADVYEQLDKWINDALNNEWQRGITIDAWVQRVLNASGRMSVRR
jgi:hypothetical protein